MKNLYTNFHCGNDGGHDTCLYHTALAWLKGFALLVWPPMRPRGARSVCAASRMRAISHGCRRRSSRRWRASARSRPENLPPFCRVTCGRSLQACADVRKARALDDEHRRRASISAYRPPSIRPQNPTPKPKTERPTHRFPSGKTLIDSGGPPFSADLPTAESSCTAPPPKRRPGHARPRSIKPLSPHI